MGAVIDSLDRVRHRLVRAVAQESTPAAAALFDTAAGVQREWTASEWQKVLDELDACEHTVGEWLEFKRWLS